jgi:hypothetical protein
MTNASGFTTGWMNNILNRNFGNTDFTTPAYLYIGLCASVANDGTPTSEFAFSGNYGRVNVNNNTASWNTASANTLNNKIAFTFNAATSNWGNCNAFFIAKDATSTATANIVAFGPLTVNKTISTGDTPSFAAGDMTISMANSP